MLHVELFGRFAARTESSTVHLRDGSKAQQLFAYLLLNGRHPLTREAVASVLWDDCTTATSKTYLRKALWQLQTALDRCVGRAPPLLELDTEWIQLNPAREMRSDVSCFEGVYEQTRGVDGANLGDGEVHAMQQAVQLYRGGLLPNRFEHWCLVDRERFRVMYMALHDKLMDYFVHRMRYDEAIVHGSHIIRCDGAREHTHRRLMWLHYLRGDRSSALRQYGICTSVLEAELGVEPFDETTELFEQIRSGTVRRELPEPVSPRPPALEVRELQARLRQLQAGLRDLGDRTGLLVSELEGLAEPGGVAAG